MERPVEIKIIFYLYYRSEVFFISSGIQKNSSVLYSKARFNKVQISFICLYKPLFCSGAYTRPLKVLSVVCW